MTLVLLGFIIATAVLATAAVTFYRTAVVPFPADLYAGESLVAQVDTRTLLQRQRTALTSLRLVQAEKRLPIIPPPWQQRGSFLDLREVNSVHLSLGLSFGLLATAILCSAVILPLGWLLLGVALITRVVSLEFRAGTARLRVTATRQSAGPLAEFLGAVQRLARADKGLPEVLRSPAPSWKLLDDGWFHLDGVEFGLFAGMTVLPIIQRILQGQVSLGDPFFGSLALALAVIAGGRRGPVVGAAIGFSATGALLGAVTPLPFVSAFDSPLQLFLAGAVLTVAGLVAGLLRRVHPALAPLSALLWVVIPFLHDRTLYDGSVVYLTAACGAAIAAVALLVLLAPAALPPPPMEPAPEV
jgi:hypothetical protein